MSSPLVYVSSSLRNKELNREVADVLEHSGYSVYLPQRDAPATGSSADVFASNIEALRRADVVVAVLVNYGRDLAFELGFAHALGKPIIALAETSEYLRDEMIANSITKVVKTLGELRDELRNTLKSA